MYIYHILDNWTPQSYPLCLGLLSYLAPHSPILSTLSTPPFQVQLKGE
jgi:hypothetical protein